MSDRYRIIDATTGEEVERSEVTPGELEDTLKQTERQVRMANARITRMERDEEADARKHKRWDEAEAVHTWWRLATGHFGRKFGAEEFRQIEPRLREVGPVGVLKAIAGAAYDPSTQTMRNGRLKKYDDFELVARNRAKLDNFTERAPGPANGHGWKRWLLDRIEENLTGQPKKGSKPK